MATKQKLINSDEPNVLRAPTMTVGRCVKSSKLTEADCDGRGHLKMEKEKGSEPFRHGKQRITRRWLEKILSRYGLAGKMVCAIWISPQWVTGAEVKSEDLKQPDCFRELAFVPVNPRTIEIGVLTQTPGTIREISMSFHKDATTTNLIDWFKKLAFVVGFHFGARKNKMEVPSRQYMWRWDYSENPSRLDATAS